MNSRCCSVFPTPPAAPRLILRLPTLGSEIPARYVGEPVVRHDVRHRYRVRCTVQDVDHLKEVPAGHLLHLFSQRQCAGNQCCHDCFPLPAHFRAVGEAPLCLGHPDFCRPPSGRLSPRSSEILAACDQMGVVAYARLLERSRSGVANRARACLADCDLQPVAVLAFKSPRLLPLLHVHASVSASTCFGGLPHAFA